MNWACGDESGNQTGVWGVAFCADDGARLFWVSVPVSAFRAVAGRLQYVNLNPAFGV